MNDQDLQKLVGDLEVSLQSPECSDVVTDD